MDSLWIGHEKVTENSWNQIFHEVKEPCFDNDETVFLSKIGPS